MKNIAINASGGGLDKGIKGIKIIESDICLKISKIIKEELDSYNVKTLLLRENDEDISYDDRIKILNNTFKDKSNTIVISNTLNQGNSSGIEIIYPLNKEAKLPYLIENNLSKFNNVEVYQYKYALDPRKDYYYITRKTEGYETIIIRYGYIPKDEENILNNYKNMAKGVSDAIKEYLNLIGNYYIVKKGDTLYSISKKYNMTVDELKKINNLNNNLININQKIKVN